jgi:hypothetical protein
MPSTRPEGAPLHFKCNVVDGYTVRHRDRRLAL